MKRNEEKQEKKNVAPGQASDEENEKERKKDASLLVLYPIFFVLLCICGEIARVGPL